MDTQQYLDVSLEKNMEKLHYVKMDRFRFTGRLIKINKQNLIFTRRDGEVVIVDFNDILTMSVIPEVV